MKAGSALRLQNAGRFGAVRWSLVKIRVTEITFLRAIGW
jgi:hypothetical protein